MSLIYSAILKRKPAAQSLQRRLPAFDLAKLTPTLLSETNLNLTAMNFLLRTLEYINK
jgi:hypothetical protein